MNAQEILSRWLEYTEFDEKQRTFNILSSNYYFHHITFQMKKIMNFDQSGTLAVLFAKQAFISICKDARVSYFDWFSNPDAHLGDKAMWDLLVNSPDIRAVEEDLIDRIDTIASKVISTKMLGERDKENEREVLLQSIYSVVDEFCGCHERLFRRGGEIRPIEYFSTHIHVFDKMSHCVLGLEQDTVRDGLYLCFIRNGDSLDCYFTFMLKNNDNIISIDERVREKYPGQHKNSRNGNWGEEKKYALFPYRYIVDCDDYDYKGYSHKQVIDEEKLAFFHLPAAAYMPILLGMVCIATKYAGTKTDDMRLMLIDSLLPWNLALPSPASEAISVPSDSRIVAAHAEYTTGLTSEDVLSGKPGDKYYWKNVGGEKMMNGAPAGDFEESSEKNIFVKLYGEGFTLHSNELLVTDPHLRLTNGSKSWDKTPNNEYIDSADWMGMIAYQQARQQLAGYIREKMYAEYVAFGGKDAIEKWFTDALASRKDDLFDLCVKKYLDADKNDKAFEQKKPGVYHPFNKNRLNQYGREIYDKHLCPVTGAECSLEFIFDPRDWKELEALLGPLPKLLTGWKRDGHSVRGNTILDVTDAVSGIGTLCEHDEQSRNEHFQRVDLVWDRTEFKEKEPRPRTNFHFVIAFSKSGMNKLIKNREQNTSCKAENNS